MQVYLDLLRDIMDNGDDAEYRNGVRRSVFGRQLRFNLKESFPLVNTHTIFTRGFVEELMWFISGSTNIASLKEKGVNIWNLWALQPEDAEDIVASVVGKYPEVAEHLQVDQVRKIIADGWPDTGRSFANEIGPLYGYQWRYSRPTFHAFFEKVLPEDVFADRLAQMSKDYHDDPEMSSVVPFENYITERYSQYCDQLNNLVMRLRNNPNHTGMIVSAWDPTSLPYDGIKPSANVLFGRQALAPCHTLFQAYVRSPATPGGKRRLSLQLYQRSCDAPVGLPYNIAQYALLTHMLAAVCDMEADEFVWTGGNIHIYSDQMELVKQELAVTPATNQAQLVLRVPENRDLTSFDVKDIEFVGYDPQSKIRYPVSE